MGNTPNAHENTRTQKDVMNRLDQMADKSPQKEANKPQRTIYRQNTRQKTQVNQPQQQDPNKAIEYKNQGNQAILQKQFQQAVECYTNAIKLYPDTIFYSNRAVAYRLMNALDKALQDARKSVEMDQNNPRGHYLVGTLLILEVQKDKEFGEQLLKKAMEGVKSLDKAWELIKNITEEGKQKLKASIKLNQGKAKRVVYLIANIMDNRNIDSLNQILQIVIQNSKKKIDLKKFQQIMRKNTIEDVKVPDYFNCIITQEIMRIPVLLSSGYTYDKESIIQHFKTNGVKDPITRKDITTEPIMNYGLLEGIQNLTSKYGWLGIEESNDYKTIQFD